MRMAALPARVGARTASRLSSLTPMEGDVAAAELAVLLMLGAASGCTAAMVKLHLRVPGHQILFSIFPMALGMALVPRRGAGSLMSAAGVLTAVTLSAIGLGGMGGGAWTSLVAAGPLLDLAVARARTGSRLYGAFVLAGIGANLLALATRTALRLPDALAATPGWMRWWPRAAGTYVISGLLAGLISAAAWFQLRERPEPPDAT